MEDERGGVSKGHDAGAAGDAMERGATGSGQRSRKRGRSPSVSSDARKSTEVDEAARPYKRRKADAEHPDRSDAPLPLPPAPPAAASPASSQASEAARRASSRNRTPSGPHPAAESTISQVNTPQPTTSSEAPTPLQPRSSPATPARVVTPQQPPRPAASTNKMHVSRLLHQEDDAEADREAMDVETVEEPLRDDLSNLHKSALVSALAVAPCNVFLAFVQPHFAQHLGAPAGQDDRAILESIAPAVLSPAARAKLQGLRKTPSSTPTTNGSATTGKPKATPVAVPVKMPVLVADQNQSMDDVGAAAGAGSDSGEGDKDATETRRRVRPQPVDTLALATKPRPSTRSLDPRRRARVGGAGGTAGSKKVSVPKMRKPGPRRLGGGFFRVERILDDRENAKGEKEYHIKWVGYPESANTWEPAENVNATALADYFAQGRRRSGRVVPE